MPMRLAAALVLGLAFAFAAISTAPALADGDPASDVLLGENVFYPYQPAVSNSLQAGLNAEAAAAASAKFPLKVALIASPTDLGVIPDLFGKPQQYADFLDQEISFQTRQPLLVVMAAGYGVQGMSAAAKAAVASLPKPAGAQSNDLARAAITAVSRIAQAAGHRLKLKSTSPASSDGGNPNSTRTILLAVLILAALSTAATLVVMRRRAPS